MEYLCESDEDIIVRIRGQQGRRSRLELQFFIIITIIIIIFKKTCATRARGPALKAQKKKKCPQ